MEKHSKWCQKKAVLAILIPEQVDVRLKTNIGARKTLNRDKIVDSPVRDCNYEHNCS